MASVNVSQYLDYPGEYAGYGSEYAYATISWDEGPTVTVKITSMNVVTWRIRGRGSDTTVYCTGTGGARTGTFNATDGKDYVFQIYSEARKTYSDGDVFTVNFGSGGSSGSDDDDDDDDDDSGLIVQYLDVNIDDGIESVNIYKSWDEAHGNHGEDMSNGGWIYSKDDCIHVEISDIKVKQGYTINTHLHWDYISRPYMVSNLDLVTDGIHTWSLLIPADAAITFTTTLNEYKLSAATWEGSSVIITRTSSRKDGAPLGVLSNGATIYHYDTLEILVDLDTGYDIVDTIIDGCTENSDGTFTVVGNVKVTVMTELLGLAYIHNGTTFVPCLVFIDNGSNWVQCIPYLDNGTTWNICS